MVTVAPEAIQAGRTHGGPACASGADVVACRKGTRSVAIPRASTASGAWISHRLPLGPPPRRDPPPKIGDRLFGDSDMKRPNGRIRVHASSAGAHDLCPFSRAENQTATASRPMAVAVGCGWPVSGG